MPYVPNFLPNKIYFKFTFDIYIYVFPHPSVHVQNKTSSIHFSLFFFKDYSLKV